MTEEDALLLWHAEWEEKNPELAPTTPYLDEVKHLVRCAEMTLERRSGSSESARWFVKEKLASGQLEDLRYLARQSGYEE